MDSPLAWLDAALALARRSGTHNSPNADAWLVLPTAEKQRLIRNLFTRQSGGSFDPLQLVIAPENLGIFASIGRQYRFAVFGRDSIETAEDILALRPELVREIILILCRLQGVAHNQLTEEEPGKIHHEHRSISFAGEPIPDSSLEILRTLQGMWGETSSDELTYYGAVDVTPLFVRLVGRYIDQAGNSILDEQVTGRDGLNKSVRDCVHAATIWLSEKLQAHPLGLLAYQRLNPDGIHNQCWKDSIESHVHADGSLPNYDQPIVSIELQGFAYDALLAAIKLGIGSEFEHVSWQRQAQTIQQHSIDYLWMNDQQYFAQGLDVGPDDQPRKIRTITSDAAAMLDSSLIHDLPAEQARRFIDGISATVFSSNMLTDVGVRCRSLEHWGIVDHTDYHGCSAVWPKEVFDIAKGLRRAGLGDEADDLEQRIRQSLETAGDFMELFYVDRDGSVLYDPEEAVRHFEATSNGHHVPKPEPGQAWTIAAAVNIAARTWVLPNTLQPHRFPVGTKM